MVISMTACGAGEEKEDVPLSVPDEYIDYIWNLLDAEDAPHDGKSAPEQSSEIDDVLGEYTQTRYTVVDGLYISIYENSDQSALFQMSVSVDLTGMPPAHYFTARLVTTGLIGFFDFENVEFLDNELEIGNIEIAQETRADGDFGEYVYIVDSDNSKLALTYTPFQAESEGVTPESEPKKPEPSAEEDVDAPDERGIIGSHCTDVNMGLEHFGLPNNSFTSAPEDAWDVYRYSSSSMGTNTEIDSMLDYSMALDKDLQIVSSSFGITWSMNYDNAVFIAAAQTYLGVVASLPYTAADSEAAQAWVMDNVPTVADDGEISETFGDATYTLSGVCGTSGYTSFVLSIQKAVV